MKIIDTKQLRYHSGDGLMEIDEEHIYDSYGYSTTTNEFVLGMKPLGRIYFRPATNLDYVDGTPVEMSYISGGEKGVIDKYLKAGERVYTQEMVVNIINSRCYDKELLPKLPLDVYELLSELSENKGKNKPTRAKEILDKYEVLK